MRISFSSLITNFPKYSIIRMLLLQENHGLGDESESQLQSDFASMIFISRTVSLVLILNKGEAVSMPDFRAAKVKKPRM